MHHEERRPAPAAEEATATFLFADIAGYTALTEAHGDEQAANLVAQFFEAISEELPTWGGTHVKTIGDAVMLHIPDPGQAVLLGRSDVVPADVVIASQAGVRPVRGSRQSRARTGSAYGRGLHALRRLDQVAS